LRNEIAARETARLFLHFFSKEVHQIYGESSNGVGKSTRIECIMGEEATKSGSIEFSQEVELTK
tara:strand:+ start:235 stop:426 length:192 start_codon:yes stop_codon:yes gene_type:complete